MIRSQQARCGRVAPRAVTRLENFCSRKHSERARECTCICSGLARKFFCTSRQFPQRIGDTEFRDGVKTPGKTVTHRDL